jgi:hypothetical protein
LKISSSTKLLVVPEKSGIDDRRHGDAAVP